MITIRFFVILLVSSLFSILGMKAWNPDVEQQYVSRKIQTLAEALPLSKLPVKDTIFEIPALIKNKSIIFQFNRRKELTHVGISLFTEETKEMLDRNICNFLERFFLELLLQGDKMGICFKLEEYHVQMWLDGQDYAKKNLWTLANFLQIMEMPVNFSMAHNEGFAQAKWTFGGHSLHLKFPLYRELITGTDKKESDEELYNQLQGIAFVDVHVENDKVIEQNLVNKGSGIYVKPGETFQIKSLSSDSYYVKENDLFVPLFDDAYPEYSMSNLFLTYTHGLGKTLQLTHRKYGRFTPEISIPLINFLDFFRKEFILTCNTKYNKKGELETIIVFSHKTLNYIHLMRVRANKQQLFEPETILKGDFYSNIPQHYIKTLFK